MKLNLKNPIVFFDLETTGINVAKDRIVEIAAIKINLDQSEETLKYRINPEMHIPKKTSEIHGIYDEDIKDSPTFKEVAKKVAKFIEGCDLGGYNSNKFDIPLIAEEFLRADVDIDMKKRKFVDVQTIFHKKEKRTLEAAYKFFCDKELTDAHSAEADTRATYEILLAQLDRYEDLKNDIDYLAEFSSYGKTADFAGRLAYDEDGDECVNFGKHKGKKVTDILKSDPGYYGWIMQGDFPLYTKKIFTEIKLRNFQM
ncbi:3'-5' exonuclease [Saccharicrinis aurantiacus]|uniref:3'-5' exonuclease n=1 Tax=Saccharicrinis aurantiacus TaxID=1849719 RepID=UPI00094FC1AA|nr:3'-5' exonuclease [Saccharicrinis aurantiacus]